MKAVVEEYGWDGAWFSRAYDHHGEPVGSKDCAEGQIYIEPQGMLALVEGRELNGWMTVYVAQPTDARERLVWDAVGSSTLRLGLLVLIAAVLPGPRSPRGCGRWFASSVRSDAARSRICARSR